MKIVLALLLALAAGGAIAHSTLPAAAPAPAHASAEPANLQAALRFGSEQQGCAAAKKVSLVADADSMAIFGDIYCRKMLACCDAGNASCCDRFDRYCNPEH
jgi:hypothetical protein